MLDIINLTDGRRLGSLYDLDIDMATGRVRALIVPGESGLLGVTARGEIEIPWSRVRKIGVDVILVEMPDWQGVAPGGAAPRWCSPAPQGPTGVRAVGPAERGRHSPAGGGNPFPIPSPSSGSPGRGGGLTRQGRPGHHCSASDHRERPGTRLTQGGSSREERHSIPTGRLVGGSPSRRRPMVPGDQTGRPAGPPDHRLHLAALIRLGSRRGRGHTSRFWPAPSPRINRTARYRPAGCRRLGVVSGKCGPAGHQVGPVPRPVAGQHLLGQGSPPPPGASPPPSRDRRLRRPAPRAPSVPARGRPHPELEGLIPGWSLWATTWSRTSPAAGPSSGSTPAGLRQFAPRLASGGAPSSRRPTMPGTITRGLGPRRHDGAGGAARRGGLSK